MIYGKITKLAVAFELLGSATRGKTVDVKGLPSKRLDLIQEFDLFDTGGSRRLQIGQSGHNAVVLA